jgi:hypothetical protein
MSSTNDNKVKLDINQKMYDLDLISYEEYQKKKVALTKAYEKQREDTVKAAFSTIADAAGAIHEVVDAMMNQEISKVNSRYDSQIKAAKKAGKDTTKLEEKKEAEINAIKKKYADKQFNLTVLQVVSTTAVAAMEAYKAMAGIPVVGPILGAIASAATLTAGAAQIQVAKQQRDEAKGLKSGGFSDEYAKGFTAMGNPNEVAGVIPVHKNEFVTNHEGVANPHVKQFLDVFDIAQKNGSIRMINTTQILERIRSSGGKYEGGYTNDSQTKDFGSASASHSGEGIYFEKIIRLLMGCNELLVAIKDKELTVDSRSVRDGIKRIENLEKNVSR